MMNNLNKERGEKPKKLETKEKNPIWLPPTPSKVWKADSFPVFFNWKQARRSL